MRRIPASVASLAAFDPEATRRSFDALEQMTIEIAGSLANLGGVAQREAKATAKRRARQ